MKFLRKDNNGIKTTWAEVEYDSYKSAAAHMHHIFETSANAVRIECVQHANGTRSVAVKDHSNKIIIQLKTTEHETESTQLPG